MLNLFNSRGEQEKEDVAELLSFTNYRVEFDSYVLASWTPAKLTQACLWAMGIAEDTDIDAIVAASAMLERDIYNIFGTPASMTFDCDMDTYNFFMTTDSGEGAGHNLMLGVNSVDCTTQLPRIYRDFINRVLSVAGADVDGLTISPAPWYMDHGNTRAVSVIFNHNDEQLWKRLRAAWSKEWLLSKAQYGVAGRPIYSTIPAGVDGDTDVDSIIEKIEAYGHAQAEKHNLQAMRAAYQDLQWLWWTRDKFHVVPTVVISE